MKILKFDPLDPRHENELNRFICSNGSSVEILYPEEVSEELKKRKIGYMMIKRLAPLRSPLSRILFLKLSGKRLQEILNYPQYYEVLEVYRPEI